MWINNNGQDPETRDKAVLELCAQLDYTTASGTYTLDVPAGYLVDEVMTVATQDFDGSPTLKVGDGDDDDGYLDNTDIALGTAATGTTPAVKRSRNSGNPYANGKYYATRDTIDFTWVKGTNPTKGVLKVVAFCHQLPKCGVPAGATATTPL